MLSELRCPHCGRINDLHKGPHGEPVAGDVGICWGCRGLTVLTPFGFLRAPGEDEQAKLAADPAIRRALAAMTESTTPVEALHLLNDTR
jgi:hypothetical protein